MGLDVTAGTVCHIGALLYRTFAAANVKQPVSLLRHGCYGLARCAQVPYMSEISGQAVNFLLSSVYLRTVTGGVIWMLALCYWAISWPMISLAISLKG